MAAKMLAAPVPRFGEAPPLARALRQIVLRLIGRLGGPAKPERVLSVEDRLALGPKKALVLVRCHGQRFLVAVSGDTIGPFTEVAGPKLVSKSSAASARRIRQEREA